MSETSVRPGWDTGDWSGMPPVTIHPYDPRWPARYEAARAQIAQALAGLDVRIEHVGSTSVPGLGARNGIDILIGLVGDLSSPAGVEMCVTRLQTIGFRHHFSEPGWTHLSGNGCKLHLRPLGSELWSEQIVFRDYSAAPPRRGARLRPSQARASPDARLRRRTVRRWQDGIRALHPGASPP